jgi:hypothetical protein
MTTLRAYHVTWNGEYSALAWHETRNKARAMCVGHYVEAEYEPYSGITARRVPHIENHPDAPTEPCVMDGGNGYPSEKDIIEASRIFYCPDCGENYNDHEGSCICEERHIV